MMVRFSICAIAGIAALTCGAAVAATMAETTKAARPVPRPALAERLKAGPEIIGIVHWGLNTFTDKECGFGDADPKLLAPAKFDADQIASAAKAGGLGGLVIVCKHHDGFCLCPTKTTEYNITKTPFWKGAGNGAQGRDYVKEMERACRRNGLKFGIYVLPWDRNNAHYGTGKYTETYHAPVSVRRHLADEELVKAILEAKADGRETDTAKWMQAGFEDGDR